MQELMVKTNNYSMKNFIKIIFVSIIALSITSCATLANMDSNKWVSYELRPSQIKTNGDAFFKGRLSDSSVFEVYYQNDGNGTFYYNVLMQDFGWFRNETGGWSGYNARRTKRGHLYVNPKRKVGIYFYPSESKFDAFKIRFTQWTAK